MAALDGADDGWALADAVRRDGRVVDFRLVYVNQPGARALGRNRADLVGRLYSELWPTLREDGLMAAYASVVHTGEPITRRFCGDDGDLNGYFEARVNPLGDGIATCLANVSPTALADNTGSELEVHLRAALDAAFSGFALLRAVRPAGRVVDFEVTYANEVGAKLSGRDMRDLVGHRLVELTPHVLFGMVDRYREVVESGTTYLDQLGDPDHGAVFETKATRVADDVVALSFRDITDRARQGRRVVASEAAARAAAARTAALQSATAALARAVTVAEVYAVMTDQVRPLEGWESLVVMLREDGQLVVSHASGLTPGAMGNLRPVPLDDPYPMSTAARTRSAAFYGSQDTFVAAFPERASQARAAMRQAWAFIPLLASGRAIGVMSLGYNEPREFAEPEREALVSLGELYAQALERARLFEAQRSIAADLQHALLPAELPKLAGARHAARYLPWTSGADVGGDWYDVIPLGEDSVGVAIGDVAGHSTSAAATMGQIRNALRAYALEGHSPTNVMERLNRLLTNVEPNAMATCCYLELHLAEGTATIVLAGHLPPILCRDSDASPLDLRLGPPLGVTPDTAYVDTTRLVPHGSALVLFTDGLVEDRRVPIERGMAELCAALAGAPTGDPTELVQRVLAADIGPRPRRDDVALLAISVDESGRRMGEPNATRRFHSDASSAASARRFTADMLVMWSLNDLVDTARLLLGEVITNAVQHTVGDVVVRLRLLPDRLRVEVRDGSERRPRVRNVDADAENGRGLKIVASLADRWGHDAVESGGKVVWFELTR